MKNLIVGIALATGITAMGATAMGARGKAPPPPHQAKIAIEDARKTALDKVPGTIKHEELEKEHGLWIYSFEIKAAGEKGKAVKEVNIDADTGAVVSVEDERD